MIEVWKDIPGFEGKYQASSLGRIMRVASGKVLKRSICKAGYCVVGFVTGDKITKFEAHSLVALAFFGPRPYKHHVHHINHDKTDNRIENLEYIDPTVHKKLHATGEGGAHSTLTDKDVKEIRDLLAHGALTQVEIGKIYGVCQVNVSGIKTGRIWKQD
jgi:hypothetical protein